MSQSDILEALVLEKLQVSCKILQEHNLFAPAVCFSCQLIVVQTVYSLK